VEGDFFINDWLVQPQINTIEKEGQSWHLEPKVMQVLVYLASHRDKVCSKDKLIEAVWRDTFVGDDALIRCISEIRYVFGDDARSPQIIQTIPKAGYRLIAAVNMDAGLQSTTPVQGNMNPALAGESIAASRSMETSIAVLDEVTAIPLSEPLDPSLEAILSSPSPGRKEKPAASPPRSRHIWAITVVSVLVGLTVGFFLWHPLRTSAVQQFWSSVLNSPDNAILCVADQNKYTFITLRDAADPSRQVVLNDTLSTVVIDDLDAIVRVASEIQAQGKNYILKGHEATNLSELRSGPGIYVGAFDNAWTLRLTRPLRYHFANDAQMTQFQIVDSSNPSAPPWAIDRTQQLETNNYKDYAIAARFNDGTTGMPAVIVAGIGRGGTIAAGEFLTKQEHLAPLLDAMRSAGNKTNFEVVLSTQIIDGHPGTPKIEASYFW
jgi:DNA-binding winged helix-turn-helix (wHTH) protein